jgi:hypothetical protein
MNRFLKHFRRPFAVSVLALGLVAAPAFHSPAKAQEPAEGEAPGSGSGRPLDGYLGTVVLVLLAFFIVGKSARR